MTDHYHPSDDISLTEHDREILDRYDSHRDPTDPEELADYLNALGRMIAVCGRTDSYEIGNLLRLNGVAKSLRNGETTVDDAREFMEAFEP